jgi:hypothetical protein
LSLPREERNNDGAEFVNNCRTELDRLIEQSPNIPMDILRNFGKKFNKKEINKPDILDITPVDIFIDEEKNKLNKQLEDLKHEEKIKLEQIKNEEKIKLEQIKNEEKIKLEQIKNKETIKRELLNTENLRRKQLLKEMRLKEKLTNEKKENLIKNEKIKKKESLNMGDITGKLDKFMKKLSIIDNDNDIITPSTSEHSTSEKSQSDTDEKPKSVTSDENEEEPDISGNITDA